ncbi:MAG: hypothetical protein OEM18_08130 [Nitrosopumilus sp.]|nr:hypothetical protein [Nitrosopumilus sp.]
MEKLPKNNPAKVYCSRCDSVFESRKKFEKHLEKHNSGISCETCPIDTVISKLVNLFKRKSSHNLE